MTSPSFLRRLVCGSRAPLALILVMSASCAAASGADAGVIVRRECLRDDVSNQRWRQPRSLDVRARLNRDIQIPLCDDQTPVATRKNVTRPDEKKPEQPDPTALGLQLPDIRLVSGFGVGLSDVRTPTPAPYVARWVTSQDPKRSGDAAFRWYATGFMPTYQMFFPNGSRNPGMISR